MEKFRPYANYKASGIAWFGSVPDTWSSTRLKFECRVTIGQSPSSDDCNIDGIGRPFLQGNAEFTERHPKAKQYCDVANKIANEGELLLSVRAPVGALNVADQTYGIGRGLCSISPSQNLDRRFLWWLLPVIKAELDSICTGSTFESVSAEQVENLRFFVPHISEQWHIADFLDHEITKIDHLIAKQERLIELLKEKRQAVISHVVTKGVNPDAPMKDSGVEWLGEVPAHWVICKFSHRISFQEGPGIMADDFRDEGVPLLRIHNIQPGFIELEGCNFLEPGKVAKRWNHFRLEKGDLVISASATTGIVSEVGEEAVGAIPYTGLIRLKPGTSDIRQQYIKQLVVSGLFTTQIDLLIAGATIGHFGPSHLRQMIIALPTVEEQDEIVDYIARECAVIDNTIAKCSEAIKLQNERRTALISAAVTGKIDVRGWQKPDTEPEETATAVSA